jgi:signal peptide peptidase-like protein 2B
MRFLTIVFFSSLGGVFSQRLAILTVNEPASLAHWQTNKQLVYLANFSKVLNTRQGELVAVAPPKEDPLACEPLPSVERTAHVIVIAARGKCTFVEKAKRAQDSGAVGIIIVNDKDEPLLESGDDTTDIFVAGIENSTGKGLIESIRAYPDVRLTIEEYKVSPWDLSEGIMIVMATSLVAAGAFFATADLRVGSPLAPKSNEEVVDVTSELALSFCIMGSCMLLVLFFFMKYMIYVIIFSFCVGGFSCITSIGSAIILYMVPTLNKRLCVVPEIGPITKADLIAMVPAAVLVVSWFRFANTPFGWIFQDIIGAGFLCQMQRTLRLPNIKVASVLLSVMFFFDIFWVFISPYLTPVTHGKSVMVTVAKGDGTESMPEWWPRSVPMLLKLPAINDEFGHERMLGFGDVALPGLLVSYLRRYDILGHRQGCAGYFLPGLAGYFVGLCVTIVALFMMEMAQPALLYLVPGTLGTTLALGACRGEISELWSGKPKPWDRADSNSDEEGA